MSAEDRLRLRRTFIHIDSDGPHPRRSQSYPPSNVSHDPNESQWMPSWIERTRRLRLLERRAQRGRMCGHCALQYASTRCYSCNTMVCDMCMGDEETMGNGETCLLCLCSVPQYPLEPCSVPEYPLEGDYTAELHDPATYDMHASIVPTQPAEQRRAPLPVVQIPQPSSYPSEAELHDPATYEMHEWIAPSQPAEQYSALSPSQPAEQYSALSPSQPAEQCSALLTLEQDSQPSLSDELNTPLARKRKARNRRSKKRAQQDGQDQGQSPEHEEEDQQVQETTMMIRNIPIKLAKDEVEVAIEAVGFAGLYHFVRLPQSANGKNKGYAFVRFKDAETAAQFQVVFQDYKFEDSQTKKRCIVEPAHRPGKKASSSATVEQ